MNILDNLPVVALLTLIFTYSVAVVFFWLPEALCRKDYEDQDFDTLFKPMECPQGIHTPDHVDRCISDCWSEHGGI